MEILFKEDKWFYLIENDTIDIRYSKNYPNIDLTNIQHLDDAKVLYHYKDMSGKRHPVYYEHNGKFITSFEHIYSIRYSAYYYKDNTLVNLNLL